MPRIGTRTSDPSYVNAGTRSAKFYKVRERDAIRDDNVCIPVTSVQAKRLGTWHSGAAHTPMALRSTANPDSTRVKLGIPGRSARVLIRQTAREIRRRSPPLRVERTKRFHRTCGKAQTAGMPQIDASRMTEDKNPAVERLGGTFGVHAKVVNFYVS